MTVLMRQSSSDHLVHMNVWIVCSPIHIITVIHCTIHLTCHFIRNKQFCSWANHPCIPCIETTHKTALFVQDCLHSLACKLSRLTSFRMLWTLDLLIPISHAHCFVDFCGGTHCCARPPRSLLVHIMHYTTSFKFVTRVFSGCWRFCCKFMPPSSSVCLCTSHTFPNFQ